MDYKHSSILTSDKYSTEGLCEGIPVRIHRCPELEISGTLEAQDDWKRLVAPLSCHEGGLGPNYGFMAVSMPECIPERFRIVSYANEFAFLYDDLVDVADEGQVRSQNDELLKAFNEGLDGNITNKGGGKRQIQAKILREMLDIDRDGAMIAMQAWAKFVETSSGSQHHKSFRTLEEYLPYRCKDVGHMFWHALVTFGCDISVPGHELELVSELVMPAVRAASLTNDLFSYEKEYSAMLAVGKTNVTNAVWVLMKEHRIPLREAQERCRILIKQSVGQFIQVIKKTRSRQDLSLPAQRYVELMQYSVSGNVVWSLECPRYHRGSTEAPCPQYPPSIFGVEFEEKIGKEMIPQSISQALKFPALINQDSHNVFKKRKRNDRATEKIASNRKASPLDDSHLTSQVKSLAADIIMDPVHYINSMPSKGVRSKVISALNYWLEVPVSPLTIVNSVVNMLHSSSLMLDDLEDNSQLRRGRPSTHVVFGMSQTINSATFLYVKALDLLSDLDSPGALKVFSEEVCCLFIGQSYDIHWTQDLSCPSITQYLQMIDGKTGGLFRLLTRLLVHLSPHENHEELSLLTCLFGRFFQIRDDYQNLVSSEYTVQKGFCEDLDEGKFSFPLIHTFHKTAHPTRLRGILHRRLLEGKMSIEQKQMVLELMKEAGSFEYTLSVLKTLHSSIEMEIIRLDGEFGKENLELRLLLDILKV